MKFESTTPTSGRCILVADDNRDAAETLGMLLRLDGHEVLLANDGLEAVDVYSRVRPQIAILDIGMPGLSGYQVAQRIREFSAEPPATLIAVTGWGQRADKERAAAAGFDHHFTKPVEPERLKQLINGV
jgi:CheY-like chemotaxis protein